MKKYRVRLKNNSWLPFDEETGEIKLPEHFGVDLMYNNEINKNNQNYIKSKFKNKQKYDKLNKSLNENDKEQICLKASMPLFEEKELEIFDNNIHSIIEEYSKLHLEKKDQILTQRIIIKQEQEIKELQDRINKAIEYIEYEMSCLWEVDEIFEDMDGKDYNTWKEYDENKLLNILQGSDKE